MEKISKDFFISYTGCDAQLAEWIVTVLEKEGYSCFCQYKDIKPGQNFLLEMDKAIKNCDRVISILSEAYLQSFYADEEWTAFLAQKRYANIIPVRIEELKPDGLWASRVYIDIAGKDKPNAEKILLKGLAHLKNAPLTETIRTASLPETVKINSNFPKWNRYFTGRDVELYKIHQTLNNNESLAIIGLGGVGKSQIAIEYAYRYASEYQYIWWVNAETGENTFTSYQDFAFKNEIISKDTKETEIIIEAVCNWMQQHDNWLFIFDNIEDEKSLQRYLPPQTCGKQHILTTSRNTRFLHFSTIDIGVFTEPEACEFIERYTKKQSDEHFRELAKKMGYLPLALSQTGAYMKINKSNYKNYLELYNTYHLNLLTDDDPDRKTIATTWQISFDKINNKAPKQLLNLCAFFAPDNIYKQWFQDASEVLSDELQELRGVLPDNLKYNKIIAELTQYSLVSRNEEGALSLHRLVQDVIRDSLKEEQSKWRNYCVDIMNELVYYDFPTAESRTLFSILATHIESIINGISDEDTTKEISELYYFLGCGFYHLADYSQALKWFDKALFTNKKILGEEHSDTMYVYTFISKVYYEKGDLEKTLEYLKKALIICEKILGEKHSNAATIYNDIARVYSAQGNYEKAMKYYKKALTIYEKILGTEDPFTAITYNNIAMIYKCKENYCNALKYSKKALRISKNVLDKEHPNTAISYSSIASIYSAKGDFNRALDYHEKALAIREKVLSKEHPDTAITYNNIAMVYDNKGNYDCALEWYLKSLPIVIKILGFEHPNVKFVLNNMIAAYEKSGNPEPFAKWLEKSLSELFNK